jgi:tetratricopeptide (TPR) repeat protein
MHQRHIFAVKIWNWIALGVLAVAPPVLAADAESDRLSNEEFHAGLLNYDLRDLLSLHMMQLPGSDELPQLLLRRKMHLLVYESGLSETPERREALAAANKILADIIRNHATDDRAIEWQITLARSLIYEQAEPHFSSILYRGGTAEDRRILKDLMDQAFGALTRLLKFLDDEYARIDLLSVSQYERLEDKGYIAQLESAIPQGQYMLLWSKFYMALALNPSDPQQRLLLDEVILQLSKETTLLKDKHENSHVQAQSLLLAGMAYRRVADYPSAKRYFRDAVEVVGRITDTQEQTDLQWVITLGMVENIRTLRDAGDFDDARDLLEELRRRFARAHRNDFGRKLLLAILECSIFQAVDSPNRHPGDSLLAARLTERAAAPLIRLANESLEQRADVYAAIFDQIKAVPDPSLLHPFQQSALIAGYIAEAARLRQLGAEDSASGQTRRLDEEAMANLDRAIESATRLLKERGGINDELSCEALFNLAVAEYHKGLQLAATQDFSRVAQECPSFARSLSAAIYAVEIITQLAEDPSLRGRAEVHEAAIQALQVLVDGFPDSDSAKYWLFFFAQAFEDAEQFEDAATRYENVDRTHPHYVTAQFRALKCQIMALQGLIARGEIEIAEIRRRAGSARRDVARFVKTARQTDPERAEEFLAQADVLIGEMSVLKGVDQHEEAIELLSDFETKHAESLDLMGRVLRVRIIAFESTGRLQDAQQAVPKFAAIAPDEAGTTLQTLLDSIRIEIAELRESGQPAEADRKAAAALLFAKQIFDSASTQDVSEASMYRLRVQLAEAHLEAGQYENALSLFAEAEKFDIARYEDGKAHDPRVLLGTAKSLMLQNRHGDALQMFNRLFVESPADAPHRFEALLGDLQCRTAMGEDAAAIIGVIDQHRFLSPSLGGESLKKKILDVKLQNEKRLGRK